MDSRTTRTLLKDLIGLIPEEVGEYLAEAASTVPPNQAIVEIGSFKGKSTCYLASRTDAHVWAIDPWDTPGNITGRFGFAEKETYEAFVKQVAAMGLSEKITPIRNFGQAAALRWDGPQVGLLYVDGDHSYGSVLNDVRAWVGNLADGATVILDDYDTPKNPGVKKAADELVRLLGPYEVHAGRLAVFTF